MKRKLFLGVLAYLAFYAPALAATDGITLESRTDKTRITVGDRIRYILVFSYPDSFTLAEPEKVTELGPWEVKAAETRRETKGTTATTLVYTLTTFTTGEALIPEIVFKYTDDRKEEKEINSQPVAITVESVLAAGGTGDIRDIKPPLVARVPPWVYLAWALSIGLLVAGVFWWYKKFKERHGLPAGAPEAPPVPPCQLAMERLEALKQAGLEGEEEIKAFYSALTDILRDYFGAIYSIETRDRTTAEIYAQLKLKEPDKKTLAAIRDFFEACDLVKFAKYRPEETLCRQDWETARKLVEQ